MICATGHSNPNPASQPHGARPVDACFGTLREVDPRERMMRLHALPYSPLR